MGIEFRRSSGTGMVLELVVSVLEIRHPNGTVKCWFRTQSVCRSDTELIVSEAEERRFDEKESLSVLREIRPGYWNITPDLRERLRISIRIFPVRCRRPAGVSSSKIRVPTDGLVADQRIRTVSRPVSAAASISTHQPYASVTLISPALSRSRVGRSSWTYSSVNRLVGPKTASEPRNSSSGV